MTFVLVLVLEVEVESMKARLTVDVLEGSFHMNVERVNTLGTTVKMRVVAVERGLEIRKLPSSTH
jgi:ribosomal protein L23